MKLILMICALALTGCGMSPTPTFTQAEFAEIQRACAANGGYLTDTFTANSGHPYATTCRAQRKDK
jgi:hypothetical protein